MNYGELKARIASRLHRADLTAEIPGFVLDAQQRIGVRFGITLAPLVADTDTDEVLTGSYLLYQYASLRAAAEHLRDGEGMRAWEDLFDLEASRAVISGTNAALDPYTVNGVPPFIKQSGVRP